MTLGLKTWKVAVLPGDGIGPEVTTAACRVLKFLCDREKIPMITTYGLIGGAAIDHCGCPYPNTTAELVKESHGVLLGAVGGPQWQSIAEDKRPEQGLLALRKDLNAYTNLRPVRSWRGLEDQSPLKDPQGVDILVVRELTGGIYFGERGIRDHYHYDIMAYSEGEVERIAHRAFQLAQQRRKKVTHVDKANVLASSKLWRSTVEKVALAYPNVQLDHLYVDNAAMQLAQRPRDFDVILTGNLFGDILSDLLAGLVGSIGLLPSVAMGDGDQAAIFEPIHGSAPDIAGNDQANPVAAILSLAELLRYSLGRGDLAKELEGVIGEVLEEGVCTKDLGGPSSCSAFTGEVLDRLVNPGVRG